MQSLPWEGIKLESRKSIEIINETKNCLFEKIDKTDKLAQANQGKKNHRLPVSEMKDHYRSHGNQRSIKEYYEQLYVHKFDNLDVANSLKDKIH